MERPITPIIKDNVLNFLCEHCDLEQQVFVNGDQAVRDLLKLLDLNFNEMNAILTYFQRERLISDLNARTNSISFILRMEANDLKQRGGFVIQETILTNNLKQLLLEIEVLKKQVKPDHLETVNKISSITGAIKSSITPFIVK